MPLDPTACLLEANMRVTNDIPLGCPLLLPVGTVNCVQILKARDHSRVSDAIRVRTAPIESKTRIAALFCSRDRLVNMYFLE
jgi:hypothetical protein